MGWSIGFDSHWRRDIGYGVPAECDHPKCKKRIDRGLAHVCAGSEPYGGDGCGLYFCERHLSHCRERIGGRCCARCGTYRAAYKPKPDIARWVRHKLTDASWERWRRENPHEVETLRARGAKDGAEKVG
jgi:hypothetical protein